jgi:hypothetical protein
VARLCGICSHPRRHTIDNFMRRGLPFKQFHSKFPAFSKGAWGRHKHHIAARAEAKIEADERRSDTVPLEEKDFREINRKLRTLAVRANRSGRLPYAINAYAAISRNLEAMQRLAAKNADSELPPPIITIVFRTPEEVEAERLRARDEIRAVDPENPILQDPDVVPQPKPAKKLDEHLRRWAELGKDKLPN